MNERIKLLALDAKLIAPEYNGFDHTRLSASQQRFAELLVRECAQFTDAGTQKFILNHFGVEES